MDTLTYTKKSSVKRIVPSPPVKTVKDNYEQLDTIRFITISIIVWSHALLPEWRLRTPDNFTEQILKVIVIQAGATSTIIFFIVSGILMHSKLQTYTLKKYFNERIPRIYAPWLFIVCFNTLLIMAYQLPISQLLTNPRAIADFIPSIYNILSGLLVYGPYWFVITYLMGMVVLIIFKKYEANLLFGGCLGLMTLFYCINFHQGWIDTFHTKAIFAYTFFIWIGFRVRSAWKPLLRRAQKTSWVFFIVLAAVLFSLACYEGFLLTRQDANDSFASNRLSNIIFSFLFFLVLLKIGVIRVINNLQPRKIVYGIYLVNSIVIFGLSVVFDTYLENLAHISFWSLLGLQFIYFSTVLFFTFVIVRFLANSRRLQWIIGSR